MRSLEVGSLAPKPIYPAKLEKCEQSGHTTKMIEVHGLVKYFGRFSALRDLNLRVGAGEFIALYGRNGSGKTTLLRILAGLCRPSSGTCRIHLDDLTNLHSVRGFVGYVSHNTALYQDLTALENLRFYAKLMNVRGGDQLLVERIDQVGLTGRETEPVRNFSRGMQQRLAIARAFLHDPRIMLLDEPFTGLDQTGSDFLKSYLGKAHSGDKACIMAIHDARLGYDLADRIVVIEKGTAALDIPKSSLSLEEFQEKLTSLTG
jgi:heme ABC exporter ATP-binding subunit CcmA